MYIDYKSEDRNFGIKKELELLEDLKILFNDETITKTEERFNLFDFRCKSGFIECKSRRCNSNTYLSTIIGMNKIFKSCNNSSSFLIPKFLSSDL